jgi:hypothetical protein
MSVVVRRVSLTQERLPRDLTSNLTNHMTGHAVRGLTTNCPRCNVRATRVTITQVLKMKLFLICSIISIQLL